MSYTANMHDVEYYVKINIGTIKKWYRWQKRVLNGEIKKPKGMPILPEYKTYSGFWYWKPKDIKKIVRFRLWIPYGIFKEEE